MSDLKPLLERHPFFAELTDSDLQLIVSCAKNVRFRAGVHLIREGDPANEFFLIRTGQVALEIFAPGRGAIDLQTVGPGEVIGYSWLFPPHIWQFSARTLEDVRALSIHGTCLRDKCDEDPRLGYRLMKRFAQVILQRLQATRLQLLDLYGKPT
ncbi:MAG: cyclic nucleotide-binding domain-containing protein [Planctomycetota bacterium]